MTVSEYFILFIFFSVLGWLFECVYCTIRSHHWQNRGFLYGPLCPIYGIGVVAALIIFQFLVEPSQKQGTDIPVWLVFLACAAGSAVLEFATSWILEKCFHAVWWDYSHVPLNIQGRICLPATCGFGAAGTVFVEWIFPLMGTVSVYENSLLYEGISLLLAVFLGMDLALTIESLTRLTLRMEEAEERLNDRMEKRVQILRQGPEAVGDAVKTSAKDAGETAAIAAMLAADAAKIRLSGRDRYHLRSMKAYRPRPKKKGAEESAKRRQSIFEELKKRAGDPKDRQVHRKDPEDDEM